MKFFLPILLWLCPMLAPAQATDSLPPVKKNSTTIQAATKLVSLKKPDSAFARATTAAKPEILTSGFIDIINNGQVNASARFIRLMVGEPGKFAIPLSLYSGVSSNNFQNQQGPIMNRSNDQLVTNFINPLSGLANISIDGVLFLNPNSLKVTKAGFLYHFGEKVLTGFRTGPATEPTTGKPVNFFNAFASSGLYLQTGAWERSNAKNVGVFWLAGRYIMCKSNPSQLKEIIPTIETNGFYHGWSLAWGVEINKLVNIKVLFYKYIKKPEINYTQPIYQFSFNYSLKN